jgi:hypothetical protein
MRRKFSVRWSPQQYKCLLPVKRILLLLVLLLPVLVLSAQVEEPPPLDTTMEEDSYEEPVTRDRKEYFLNKWLDEAGIDSLRLRRLPDTAIASLKRDAAFWYADSVFRNLKREIEEQQQQSKLRPQAPTRPSRPEVNEERSQKYESVSGTSWFQALLWVIVVGGFLAVVIMYLVNSNVQLFRKSSRRINADDEVEVDTEDIFAINYQKEIDKAAASKNYRLAIRLMFLRLLKNMAERNIIQYKQDRTNFDYLLQLSASKHYHDFFRITRNYEYSWYGKFDVSDEAYELIRRDFEQFNPSTK